MGKKLSSKDQEVIWHPLTQHKTALPAKPIVRAEGALMWDDQGNSYIDGIASWYTAMYGHGHPALVEAMHRQMKQLDFVMFSGFTHAPAVTLAERLLEILPQNQKKVFYNDNGSTAIEAAVKMALQYFHNKGERRDTFIAFEDGFHGDTFGAMSVSGLASYNGPFTDFLLKVERLPVPTEHNLEAVEKQLNHILENNRCAAFVFEPLVQGAAGMKFHSPQGLDALIAICQEQDVLCIADEIMTGFGKTGKNFACDHLQRQPDIICLSKALTAGMFPLSATTCTQAIYDAFLSDEVHKGFFHAHTYSAHPLGCAVALAALDLLNAPQIQERRDSIAKSHTGFLKGIGSHPKILNARSLGVILAIDLKVDSARYGHLRDELYEFFMDRGVNIRPLGNTVYALPPFVITNEQLEQVYQSFRDCLAHF